jgi:hypothetical protein
MDAKNCRMNIPLVRNRLLLPSKSWPPHSFPKTPINLIVIPAKAGIQFKYDVRRTQNQLLSASHNVPGLDAGFRRNAGKE